VKSGSLQDYGERVDIPTTSVHCIVADADIRREYNLGRRFSYIGTRTQLCSFGISLLVRLRYDHLTPLHKSHPHKGISYTPNLMSGLWNTTIGKTDEQKIQGKKRLRRVQEEHSSLHTQTIATYPVCTHVFSNLHLSRPQPASKMQFHPSSKASTALSTLF
jgi:hypothetical protein